MANTRGKGYIEKDRASQSVDARVDEVGLDLQRADMEYTAM